MRVLWVLTAAAFAGTPAFSPSPAHAGEAPTAALLNSEIAALIDARTMTVTPVTQVAAFDALDGDAPTHAAHERKAAGRFTGQTFLRARPADESPVREFRVAAGASDIPAGWTRAGNKLVHDESGMRCPLQFDLKDGPKRQLTLAGVTTYDQRGRDVSCNYTIAGEVSITLYATFDPELSQRDHAAGAVAAMRQNFTLRDVLPVVTLEIEGKNGEPSELQPIAGAFDVGEINGVPYKTAIWLVKTQGWHVKARATYPQSDVTSEFVAAIMFTATYLDVKAKNDARPTTSGPEV